MTPINRPAAFPPTVCPGTLKPGFDTYTRTALKQCFSGKKVNHILPFAQPGSSQSMRKAYARNKATLSLSGVQIKHALTQTRGKFALTSAGERATHILKTIPHSVQRGAEMPANEHLTMQIARQVYCIETAGNALVFFSDGTPAYITRRFDRSPEGHMHAQEDFASLNQRMPATHGANFKYTGTYADVFAVLKAFVPAYPVEAPSFGNGWCSISFFPMAMPIGRISPF